MATERRNHSEIIFNKIYPSSDYREKKNSKEGLSNLNISKSKVYAEESHDNIFQDSVLFHEKNLKLNNEFNLEEILLDCKLLPNRSLIKVISTKYHNLFLKLLNDIKELKIEIQSSKSQINKNQSNINDESESDKNDKNSSLEKKQLNFGNLSLAELNNDQFIKEKKNLNYLFDDDYANNMKEEENDCLNQVIAEFNLQINELESKDDQIKRELIKKNEELNRITSEVEELKAYKMNLINETQNITLKLGEYRNFIHSLPNEFIMRSNKKSNSSSNQEEEDSQEKVYNFSLRQKEEDKPMESEEYNDILLCYNTDNQETLLKRIIEENKQIKELNFKIKQDNFQLKANFEALHNDYENLNKLKELILSANKKNSDLLNETKLKTDVLFEKLHIFEQSFEFNY